MTKPGLTLHRLRLFLAVLEEGGIARAAVKENISQPAVSEHIHGLEEYFGIQLLERVGRGVAPTHGARQIEPYARQVLQLLHSAEQVASDLQGLRKGTLTVGASSTPGTYLLPQILGVFRAQYPGVNLQLRIRNTDQVERWVATGEVELGIIGENSELCDSLSAEPWVEDELIVLINKQHSLARQRVVPPHALASEPCIARESGSSTWRAAEGIFKQVGMPLRPVMELGSTEAIREAVAAGLGIAVVSKFAAARSDPRVVAAPLTGVESRRRFRIIRRANSSFGPAATRFRELLLEHNRTDSVPATPRLLHAAPLKDARETPRPQASSLR
jgi:DNA-binding transcriptional LysR family regulator